MIRRKDLTVKQQLVLLPRRTESAIRTRRVELGVNATGEPPAVPWHASEGRIVQRNPHLSCRELADLLPGRTENAISTFRRRTLKEVRERQWRGTEDKLIRRTAATTSDAEMAAVLGRSVRAITQRRHYLGVLRTNRPQEGRAVDSVAIPLIKDIRVRARDLGVSLRHLARAAGTSGGFKPSQRWMGRGEACGRAVEMLGGELYAVWDD